MEKASIPAALRYSGQAIRSLALYPDELRARARKAAISARLSPLARQWRNGTERKPEAQCGTLPSQCLTHNGPMEDCRPRTGPSNTIKERSHG